MAVVKQEITVCDICEDPTGGFRYWQNITSSFGVIAETSLCIDICESCAKIIQYDIPGNMMDERYSSSKPTEDEINKQIKKWEKIVKKEGFKF